MSGDVNLGRMVWTLAIESAAFGEQLARAGSVATAFASKTASTFHRVGQSLTGYGRAVDAHRKRLEDLNTTLHHLQNEYDALQESQRQLQAAQHHHRSQLSQLKQEFEQFELQIQRVTTAIETLKKQEQAARDEANKLAETQKQAAKIIQESNSRIARLDQSIPARQMTLDRLRTKQAEEAATRDRLRREHAEIEANRKRIEGIAENERKRFETIQQQRQREQASLTNLERALATAHATMERLRRQEQAVQGHLERVTNGYRQAAQAVALYDAQLARLDKQIADRSRRVASLYGAARISTEGAIIGDIALRDKIREQRRAAAGTMEQLSRQLYRRGGELRFVQEQQVRTASEIQQGEQRREATRRAINELTREEGFARLNLEQFNEALQRATSAAQQYATRVTTIEQRMATRQTAIESAQQRIAAEIAERAQRIQQRAQAEHIRQVAEQELPRKIAEAEALKQQREQHRVSLQQLQRQQAPIAKQVLAHESALQGLAGREDDIRQHSAAIDQHMAKIRQDLQQTQQQFTRLQSVGRIVGQTFEHLSVGFEKTATALDHVGDHAGRFSRSFERLTRGLRGVPHDVSVIQERIYSLQLRMREQEKTIDRAAEAYRQYADSIAVRNQQILADERRIEERRVAALRQETKIALEKRKLAELIQKGDALAIEHQRRVVDEEIKTLEKKRQNILVTQAVLERNRNSLEKLSIEQERARRYLEVQRDRYEDLNRILAVHQERLHAVQDQHQRAAERKREQARASAEAQRAELLERLGITALIDKLSQLIGLKPKVEQGTRRLAQSQQSLAEEVSKVTVNIRAVIHGLSALQQFLISTAASVAGRTIFAGLQAIGNALRQMPAQAFAVTKSFDQLSFSINALLARELKREDPFLSFEEAMEATRDRTAVFVEELERLAIKSTYTSGQVTEVFQKLLNTFESDIAIGMTQVLTNFGDALGKSSYDLEGIAIALGQIQNKGKVSAEELNQLQERSIPALRYLAEAWGVTTGEMMKMIAKGQILAEDAIPAIINAIDNELGGAGEAASQTLQGLTSSIRDLSERVLRNLFGPTIREVIQPLLVQLVNTLGSDGLMTAVDQAGRALAYGFGGAVSIAEQMIGPLLSGLDLLVMSIEDTIGYLGAFAFEAYEWGSELVSAFVDGMMSRMDRVMHIVEYLSGLLAYWFEPHSPPRIAPDIDKWGQQTTEAFFEGMTTTDAHAANTEQLQRLKEATHRSLLDQMSQVERQGELGPLERSQLDRPTDVASTQIGDPTSTDIVTLLQTIAQTLAKLLDVMSERFGGGKAGERLRQKRLGGKAEEDETSEFYRQKIEESLDGEEKLAKGLDKTTRAQVAYLKSIGDTEGALELLREQLASVEEGSADYFKILKQINDLEKGGGGGGGLDSTAKAQVSYLRSIGNTAEALNVLNDALATTEEGSEDYYKILKQIADVEKQAERAAQRKAGGGGAAGGTSMGFRFNFEDQPLTLRERPELPEDPLHIEALMDEIDAARARVEERMQMFRDTLQPITDWLHEYRGVIGYVLTSIAISLARSFVASRIMPILKDLIGLLRLVGISITNLLTPINLFKLAIHVLAISWIKNIGGMRDIFQQAFRDVHEETTALWGILKKVFFGSGGIIGMFGRFLDAIPAMQPLLARIFDRLGAAFVEWLGPVGGGMIVAMQQAFKRFGDWLVKDGAEQFEQQADSWFSDLQRYFEGKTPQTFLIGVITRLAVFVATITQVAFAQLFGIISALIVAYAPRLQRLMQTWVPVLGQWILDAISPALHYSGMFLGALLAALGSGAIALIRTLGHWTIQLAGWILPAVPLMVARLADLLFVLSTWFIKTGAPSLVAMLANWITEALNQLGQHLPMFGFNLGILFGRLITQAVGLAVTAIYALGESWPKALGWFFTSLVPAVLHALWGAIRGIVAAIPGLLMGLIEPLVDALRIKRATERVREWAKDLGITFVTEFIEKIEKRLPDSWYPIVDAFDKLFRAIKIFLTGVEEKTDSIDKLVKRIRGMDQATRDMIETMKTAIIWLGSFALAVGVVAIQQAIASGVITTKFIPALINLYQVIVTRVLAALGIKIIAIQTANKTYLYTVYSGIARFVMSLIAMSKTIMTQVVVAIGAMILQVRGAATALLTGGIPALLTYIKTIKVASTVTTVFGAKLLMLLGPIAVIVAAIGSMIFAFDRFNKKVAGAAQEMLQQHRWWRESEDALNRWASASREAQEATYEQAKAIEALRESLRKKLEALIRDQAIGLLTPNEYQRRLDAIHAEAAEIENLTQKLNEQLDAHEKLAQQQLMQEFIGQLEGVTDAQRDAAQAAEDHQRKLAELEDQAKRSSDTFREAFKRDTDIQTRYLEDRERSYAEHIARIEALEAEHRDATTEEDKKAIDERIKQERESFAEREKQRAIEYVKERMEQRKHLGQMLIDYVRVQAQRNNWDRERTAQMIDTLAAEYGVQQEISERAALHMQDLINQTMSSADGNIDHLMRQLRLLEDRTIDQQRELDELTRERTIKLVTEFLKKGTYDPKELKQALDNLERDVAIELSVRLRTTDIAIAAASVPTPTRPSPAAGERGLERYQPPASSNRSTTPTPSQPEVQRGNMRARGGPVRARVPYWVGEEGPEIFVPHQHGAILNNRVSQVLSRIGTGIDYSMHQFSATIRGGWTPPEMATSRPGGISVSMPITISGNTVRSDDDLLAIERRVTETIVGSLETILVQGLKG